LAQVVWNKIIILLFVDVIIFYCFTYAACLCLLQLTPIVFRQILSFIELYIWCILCKYIHFDIIALFFPPLYLLINFWLLKRNPEQNTFVRILNVYAYPIRWILNINIFVYIKVNETRKTCNSWDLGFFILIEELFLIT